MALLFGSGCAYVQNSIREDAEDPKARAYPATIEAELERQENRANWSAIAGPFEMLGGGAIIFLGVKTIGAPANPSAGGSTSSSVIKDATASAIVSSLLIAIGGALVVGGFGDLFAGTVGRATESPFIIEGERGEPRLLASRDLDKKTSSVSQALQLDASLEIALSERGSELRVESGGFQWLSRAVRLRYGIAAIYGSPLFVQDRWTPYVGAGPAFYFDWSVVERVHFGRYPKGALTVYVSPAFYTAISSFEPHFGFRAGTGLTFKTSSILVGMSHVPAIDPRPQIEVTLISHFVTN